MKYYQILRSANYMTDMENKVFGKVAAEVVAWMIFSLTFLVGDYSASWAIRAEVEMAEEEERTWCIHSSEYLFSFLKKMLNTFFQVEVLSKRDEASKNTLSIRKKKNLPFTMLSSLGD